MQHTGIMPSRKCEAVGSANPAASILLINRNLSKLARWIATLDDALRPEAAAAGMGARSTVMAASQVIRAGAILAGHLCLPLDTVQQLARGCVTLVSSGGALLQGVPAEQGVRRAIRSRDLLGRGASHIAESLMETLQDFEFVLRSPAYAAARRAFAADAAAPGRLLPFLAACTDLLLAAGDDPKGGCFPVVPMHAGIACRHPGLSTAATNNKAVGLNGCILFRSTLAADSVGWTAYRIFGPLLAPFVQAPDHFHPLQAQLENDPALQQRMARLLLRCLELVVKGPSALPRVSPPSHVAPASLGGTAAADSFFFCGVASALGSRFLWAGLQRELQQVDAVAALRTAAQALRQLPQLSLPEAGEAQHQLPQSGGWLCDVVTPEDVGKMHRYAFLLLCGLLAALPMGGWSDEQLARGILAPPLLQQAGQVALGLVPRILHTMRVLWQPEAQPLLLEVYNKTPGLAGRAGPPDLQLPLLLECKNAAFVLFSTSRIAEAASLEQVQEWQAAATACLCMLPLACQLALEQQGPQQQQPQPGQQRRQATPAGTAGSGDVAASLRCHALDFLQRCIGVWGQATRMTADLVGNWASAAGPPEAGTGSQPPAPSSQRQLADPALSTAVWELHTQACRLIHFILRSPPAQRQLLESNLPCGWLFLAYRLGRSLLAARTLAEAQQVNTSEGGSGSGSGRAALAEQLSVHWRPIASMGAAHLEAMSALLPRLPASDLEEEHVQLSVLAAAADAPRLASEAPSSRQLLERTLQAGLQARAQAPWEWCSFLLRGAGPARSSHLTAELFRSGLLARMLLACRTAPLAGAAAKQAAQGLVNSCFNAITLLMAELLVAARGRGWALHPSDLDCPTEVVIHLLAAAEQLNAVLRALREAEPLEQPGVLQAALPAATKAAATLQAWWGLPAQQQAAQLELGQAVAVRACAFLRCSNIGAEGGMAAGETDGSKRCGGCRAAWYCASMPQEQPQPPPSLYYSAAGEAEINRLYDEALASLPFSHEERLLDTASFGKVQVIVCGPPDGQPLVVWHGAALPGPFLLHSIFKPLAKRFRLYLPDIPGQGGGRSGPAVLDPATHGHGRWAAEVLEALGLVIPASGGNATGSGSPGGAAASGPGAAGSSAAGTGGRPQPPLHVGLSFGGAVLLDLAIVRPGAIRAAALVVPGSLHPDSGRNWLSYRLMLLFMLHGLLRRDWTGSLLARGMLRELCDEPESMESAMQWLHAVFRHCHTFPDPPGWRQHFTDEQLRQLAAPVLLVAAELDVFGAGRGTAQRAQRVWPGGQCEVVLLEGGRHISGQQRMAEVNERICRFFAERAGAA
ncbi:hypothetical protein ABPG75_000385 [Micractinium tetrahymenae]